MLIHPLLRRNINGCSQRGEGSEKLPRLAIGSRVGLSLWTVLSVFLLCLGIGSTGQLVKQRTIRNAFSTDQ